MSKRWHASAASVTTLLFAASAAAGACGPGQAGNCQPSAEAAQASAPSRSTATTTCSAVGSWIDSGQGEAVVAVNLAGTIKFPYCSAAHSITITEGTSGFNVFGTWSGSSECQSFTETLTYQGCNTATGPYTNADGGSGTDTWTRTSRQTVAIVADISTVPSASRVLSGKVLSRSNLSLTVTDNGAPVPGALPLIESDRGATDVITQPAAVTDASGKTSAAVETRAQPGPSTIRSANPDIQTGTAASITWLPAHYESAFLVTCYVISLESDFLNSPLTNHVNGLPADQSYHRGFINDVRLQGSGQALSGLILHYDGRGRYSQQNCALTATGACAVDGTTIAVDRTVIPLRSSVNIATVGGRTAQDTGGAITDYHIDEYFGIRRAACLAAGHRNNLSVDFSNY